MKQIDALAILKTGVNVFLTGEPGAGKTHVTNLYTKWLRDRGIEAAVTASTGIAATHINGMTIHSWAAIGIKNKISESDITNILYSKKYAVERICSAKVLIIDEISMLGADTVEAVDTVLRKVRGHVMGAGFESQPFGGMQVIFVGDFFQLPPVTKEGPTKFAFESEAWKKAEPVTCYLTEQHRQDDEVFLGILTALRNGALTKEHKSILLSRIAKPIADRTMLFTHNIDVDRVNVDRLAQIAGTKSTFNMRSYGPPFLVDTLKKNCLSPESLDLKVGALVMFTRNNFDVGYVNGTIGEITRFENGMPVVKTKGGRTINAEWAEWSIMENNRAVASVTQIPLRLAWAITVHKSQGMSLDAASIDLSRAFEYGQGYVALSRVKSLEGLNILTGLNEKALQMHPTIVQADAEFRSPFKGLQQGTDLEEMQAEFLKRVGSSYPQRPVKDVDF